SPLRRASLLACNPRICAHVASDHEDAADADSGGDRKRRRVMPMAPSPLLVANTAGGRHKEDVRRALETHPEARCLVEFCGDSQQPCIMTLYEDGFVWNQEAFLDRRSRQFESVARQNPFMLCLRGPALADAGSDSDSDGGGAAGPGVSDTMIQVYPATVHEIRHEDCPRLFA
ncbi:hypothetical protein IWQ56_003024, partial [Coemansia nantahalensis]